MEWFEDDLFWKNLYPALFNEAILKDSDEIAEKILRRVALTGNDVLDLCCGPGRMSLVFAKRGFHVVGVDRTRFYLDKASEKAQAQGLNIEWIEEDMRRFVRPNAFDLILNMYTSFGYFERPDDNLAVLRNVFTNLKPGGHFIIDIMGKEILAKVFQPTTSVEFPDGTILVQRHEIIDDWTRNRNEWFYIHNGSIDVFRFVHAVYSGQELKEMLQRAGFQNITLYGNMDGAAYGFSAERLIVFAEKP